MYLVRLRVRFVVGPPLGMRGLFENLLPPSLHRWVSTVRAVALHSSLSKLPIKLAFLHLNLPSRQLTTTSLQQLVTYKAPTSCVDSKCSLFVCQSCRSCMWSSHGSCVWSSHGTMMLLCWRRERIWVYPASAHIVALYLFSVFFSTL